jgi:hypothetical protein
VKCGNFNFVCVVWYNSFDRTLAVEVDIGVAVYDFQLQVLVLVDGVSLTRGKLEIEVEEVHPVVCMMNVTVNASSFNIPKSTFCPHCILSCMSLRTKCGFCRIRPTVIGFITERASVYCAVRTWLN